MEQVRVTSKLAEAPSASMHCRAGLDGMLETSDRCFQADRQNQIPACQLLRDLADQTARQTAQLRVEPGLQPPAQLELAAGLGQRDRVQDVLLTGTDRTAMNAAHVAGRPGAVQDQQQQAVQRRHRRTRNPPASTGSDRPWP